MTKSLDGLVPRNRAILEGHQAAVDDQHGVEQAQEGQMSGARESRGVIDLSRMQSPPPIQIPDYLSDVSNANDSPLVITVADRTASDECRQARDWNSPCSFEPATSLSAHNPANLR